MNFFLKDPKEGTPSVSLTLLMVSFIAVLVGSALHMTNKVEDTSVLTELFYTTSALYFGRRFSMNKGDKTITTETTEGTK